MAAGAPRKQLAHRFATNEPGKFIEVSVSYNEGGARFSDLGYGNNPRAYFLHVTPCKIEQRGDVEIKSFMMYSGFKSRLEAVKRLSAKKLDELADRTRRECDARDDTIMQIVNRVLEQENLTLQEAVHV